MLCDLFIRRIAAEFFLQYLKGLLDTRLLVSVRSGDDIPRPQLIQDGSPYTEPRVRFKEDISCFVILFQGRHQSDNPGIDKIVFPHVRGESHGNPPDDILDERDVPYDQLFTFVVFSHGSP